MIKLFTVGFAREMDELQLDELFSQHGLVKTLTIIRDQQTGISKGYAFVQMMDQPGAERAIKHLDGLLLGGRTLNVRYADAPGAEKVSAAVTRPPSGSTRAAGPGNRTRRPRLRK